MLLSHGCGIKKKMLFQLLGLQHQASLRKIFTVLLPTPGVSGKFRKEVKYHMRNISSWKV